MNNLLTKLKLRKLQQQLLSSSSLDCCTMMISKKTLNMHFQALGAGSCNYLSTSTSTSSSSSNSSSSISRGRVDVMSTAVSPFRSSNLSLVMPKPPPIVHNYYQQSRRHFRGSLAPRSSDLNNSSSNSNSNSSSFSSKVIAPPSPTSWIDSDNIPPAVRPYLHLCRADKQAGSLLLLWPCIWGVSLAAPMGCLPDPLLIAKFAIGSLIMRGAGCTINDLFDKDFDKHVERTKNRPLASGALTSKQAIGFLAAQLSVGLGILLSFDNFTIQLGMASMPLVVAYPLMKRITYFPQLILGLAFNWGALVGWSSVCGTLDYTAAPLYISGVFWTLVYDTVYGYQDRVDDAKLGLKSTSLYLGDKPQVPLTCLALLSSSSLAVSGLMAGLSAPFFIGTGLVTSHLMWQVWTMNVNETANLWSRFNSNKYLGGLVAASIIAGHF